MNEGTEIQPTKGGLTSERPGADTGTSLPDVVARAVIIDRPRADLYAYCSNLSNLPSFMTDVKSVVFSDDGRHARWISSTAKDELSWETSIAIDEPGQVIGWRTQDGSKIEHEGRLEFTDAPGGRGTLVSATIAYRQVGGSVGGLLARVFHKDPRIQTQRDLRRFKQLMETGELATARPPAAAPRG